MGARVAGSRVAAGLALALVVALAARRARSLSPSGATAAVVVGTSAVAAGWAYGALLIAYFVASSALSRWRAAEKTRRTDAVVEKGGERDARQVLANGLAFAACALGTLVTSPRAAAAWGTAAAGALAAAAADTWATEIGTLSSRPPRSVLTGRVVPAGDVDSRMTRFPFFKCGRMDCVALSTNDRSAVGIPSAL